MKIRKNSSKIIQISLVALVGASLVVSCKKPGSSSEKGSEKTNQPSSAPSEPQPKLTVTIPVTQIEAKIGTKKVQAISIKNEGKEVVKDIVLAGFEEPLTVAEGENGCTDKTLKPSESCEVNLTFKPTEVKSDKKTIAISYNNDVGTKPKNESFEVSYLGRGDVKLDFSTLAQLKAELNQSDTKTLTITNNGDEAATGLQVSSLTSPLFSSTTCKEELAPSASCEVEVKFSPKEIKSGSEKLQISYKEVASTEKVTKETDVRYSAIGKANIEVDVGQGKLIANDGTEEIRKIIIRNKGSDAATGIKAPNIVSPLSIKSNSCSAKPLEANKTCEIEVKFSPNSPNFNASQQIAIEYQDGTKKQNTVSTLSYMSVAKDVLNLSKYEVATSNIEVNTTCTTKKVYGNGKHGIPITSKFTASDKNGNKIEVAASDLLAATKIQLRDGNNDVLLSSLTEINKITSVKDDYSRCIDSSVAVPSQNVQYFKTSQSGASIVLGAKLQYVDKNGVISTVSTTESGRERIEALSKVNYTGDFLNSTKERKGYWDLYADNYNLFKVSRNLSNAEKWKGLEVFTVNRVTLKDIGWPSWGFPTITCNVNLAQNQETDLIASGSFEGKFDSSAKREFDYAKIFQKKSYSGSIYTYGNNSFSLSEFLPNDIGIAVRSTRYGAIGHGSRKIDYSLQLNGYDMYGNDFTFMNTGTDL
jgi:hypothetical protein